MKRQPHRPNRQLPALPPGARTQQPRQQGRRTIHWLRRAIHYIDRLATHIIPYDPTNDGAPEQRARPTILIGLFLMFLLFGVIGLWGAVVPLAAGAIAPGRVVIDTNSKEIQHLEGGIVKDILVREGQQVEEGQVLLRLDSTSAEARSEMIRGQYVTAKATEARLMAERDRKDTLVLPEELTSLAPTDTKIREILDTQQRLFDTRREALTGQIDVLNQKIAQSAQEIRGYQEQINAANSQISLLGEEISVVQGLLAKGNALRPRLLALQRSQAELLGQRGQAQAMISRANQTINEAKITILNARTEYLNNAIAELKNVQTQLSDLTEQARAAGDVARRIEITSPLKGIVTALSVHTIGGVVQPGATLMTLVPVGATLIVEAQVNPIDIDVVQTGLKARVRLTAFHTRTVPPVEGTVINVSADRFDNERTGEAFYLARIEIPPEEMEKIGDLQLTPGMPAEALIVTGSRTMLSYLIRPIRESFGHAFHEQ